MCVHVHLICFLIRSPNYMYDSYMHLCTHATAIYLVHNNLNTTTIPVKNIIFYPMCGDGILHIICCRDETLEHNLLLGNQRAENQSGLSHHKVCGTAWNAKKVDLKFIRRIARKF